MAGDILPGAPEPPTVYCPWHGEALARMSGAFLAPGVPGPAPQSDAFIAYALNNDPVVRAQLIEPVTARMVRTFRRKWRIPPHPDDARPTKPPREPKSTWRRVALAMFGKFTDTEIAKTCGVSPKKVVKFRHAKGIPCVPVERHSRDPRIISLLPHYSDADIAKMLRLPRQTVRRVREAEGVIFIPHVFREGQPQNLGGFDGF